MHPMQKLQRNRPIQLYKYKAYIKSITFKRTRAKLNQEVKRVKEFNQKPYVVNKPN